MTLFLSLLADGDSQAWWVLAALFAVVGSLVLGVVGLGRLGDG